jgi:hypothetical protein
VSSYRFRGRDRSGTARTGTTDSRDVAAVVKTRFHQGWRELTVEDADGVQVGRIGPTPDRPDHRTWWGEQCEGVDQG